MEDIEVVNNIQARRVMHERAVISNSLSSSDSDSSSVGSVDDSSEEELSKAFRFGSVLNQDSRRSVEQPRLTEYVEDPLEFPLWKDVGETSSSATSARLHADKYGEVQGSIVGHGDDSHMASTRDVMGTVVSQKLESIGIQASVEVGSIAVGASASSKAKPGSLLDAIKWNNVKKKRAA